MNRFFFTFQTAELNIDYVKIDKYFIDNIREGNDDTLITADIISMSHKVGLVVAEGVEREDQKSIWKGISVIFAGIPDKQTAE